MTYRGSLGADDVLRAINLCLENAEALIREAKILRDNAAPARAVALAITALEELGKLPKLVSYGRYEREQRWRSFWKAFRSHVDKLDLHGTAVVLESGANEATIDAYLSRQEGLAHLQDLKLATLYVDRGDAGFSGPGNIPEIEKLSDQMINMAEQGLEFHRAKVGRLTRESLERWQRLGEQLEQFVGNGPVSSEALVNFISETIDEAPEHKTP